MLVPFSSMFVCADYLEVGASAIPLFIGQALVGKIHPRPPNLPVATSFQALGSRSMRRGVTKTHISGVDAISLVIL
jgi:hypothetical protein